MWKLKTKKETRSEPQVLIQTSRVLICTLKGSNGIKTAFCYRLFYFWHVLALNFEFKPNNFHLRMCFWLVTMAKNLTLAPSFYNKYKRTPSLQRIRKSHWRNVRIFTLPLYLKGENPIDKGNLFFLLLISSTSTNFRKLTSKNGGFYSRFSKNQEMIIEPTCLPLEETLN